MSSFKIEWHDDNVRALLKKGCEKWVKQAAMRVRNEAVKRAPVRGGFRSFHPGEGKEKGGVLKASIREEFVKTDGKTSAARVVTTCGYGAYVELGTAKMKARSFLLEGFENAKAGMLSDAKRMLEGEK